MNITDTVSLSRRCHWCRIVKRCTNLHELILMIIFTAWMETQHQTNSDAIPVGGQKPMLDNSIDKDRIVQVSEGEDGPRSRSHSTLFSGLIVIGTVGI